jgi:hypothetical protein
VEIISTLLPVPPAGRNLTYRGCSGFVAKGPPPFQCRLAGRGEPAGEEVSQALGAFRGVRQRQPVPGMSNHP